MEGLDQIAALDLVLVQPERILICRRESCRYALQVTGRRVNDHLREKHGVPRAERSWPTYYLQSLHLPDPRTVPPRHDGSTAHPDLVASPGYGCSHVPCRYRTTSRELLNRHLRRHHDVRRSRNDILAEYQVLLQSWVQEGNHEYWIVRQADSSAAAPQRAASGAL
jgi:hypothetical protein